jgi:hypothetical protein
MATGIQVSRVQILQKLGVSQAVRDNGSHKKEKGCTHPICLLIGKC